MRAWNGFWTHFLQGGCGEIFKSFKNYKKNQ